MFYLIYIIIYIHRDVNFNEIKELPIELFNLKNLKRL